MHNCSFWLIQMMSLIYSASNSYFETLNIMMCRRYYHRRFLSSHKQHKMPRLTNPGTFQKEKSASCLLLTVGSLQLLIMYSSYLSGYSMLFYIWTFSIKLVLILNTFTSSFQAHLVSCVAITVCNSRWMEQSICQAGLCSINEIQKYKQKMMHCGVFKDA